jgi:hypothetical protein
MNHSNGAALITAFRRMETTVKTRLLQNGSSRRVLMFSLRAAARRNSTRL